jgi:ribose transport system permease protein
MSEKGLKEEKQDSNDSQATKRRNNGVLIFFTKYSLLILLGILIAFFSILIPDTFFTFSTLRAIISTQAVLVLVALAMLIPMAAGEFDLSAPMSLTLSMCIATYLMANTPLPMGVAILIGIGSSLTVSICNGLLVTRVGINSFVTTLGMSSLLTGVIYGLNYGLFIAVPEEDKLINLVSRTLFNFPHAVYYIALIALIVWYVMEQTPFGRYLYAIGGSKEGARLAGINTRRLTFIAFLMTGLLVGIAGIITASKLGGGQPKAGPNYLLPGFTACFLSAAAFKPGVYNVAGVIVSIFVLATGVTGLQYIGAPFYIDFIFNGTALIAAVALTRYLRGESV